MSRFTKSLLLINILLIILLGYVMIREDYPSRMYRKLILKEKPLPGYNFWYQQQQLFEVLPKDTNSILFLGNSLTSNFPLEELLHNIHVKNRGIGGDYLLSLMKRLQPVYDEQPEKIFIE